MSIRTENEIVGGGGRNEAEKEIAEIMENILLSCDGAEDESDAFLIIAVLVLVLV